MNYGRDRRLEGCYTFYKYLLFYSRYIRVTPVHAFPDDPSLNYFLSVDKDVSIGEVTPFNGPYADAYFTGIFVSRGIYWTGQNAFQVGLPCLKWSSFIAGVVCRPDGKTRDATIKYFSVDRIAQFLNAADPSQRPGWKVVRAMGQFWQLPPGTLPHQTGSRYTFCVKRFGARNHSELNTRIW
ncbi:hypothetical protein SPFM20_00188 [Salmonella phage SPFM20]|nr:hypothetical protein SPFM20_00188 [Salmonella phage SPFM20]